jgi:phosphoenolpyruvate synthase/pyruvate phosphate dikinase
MQSYLDVEECISARAINSDYLRASIRNKGVKSEGTSEPVVHIPASFVVSASAFREFMCKNRLDEVVEGLLSGVNVKRIDELVRPAVQMREIIRSAPLPDGLYDGILEGCRQIGQGATVVWPVTVPLELFHSSHQYQQSPYVEATGPEGTLEAVRRWWASLFEPAAIFYRELHGHNHRDASITVAVQGKPVPEANARD